MAKTFNHIRNGSILVLIGVILLLCMNDIVDWANFPWWLLIGLGAIFLWETIFYYKATKSIPQGRFITALILITVGICALLEFVNWWPLVLIAIGFYLIFVKRR